MRTNKNWKVCARAQSEEMPLKEKVEGKKSHFDWGLVCLFFIYLSAPLTLRQLNDINKYKNTIWFGVAHELCIVACVHINNLEELLYLLNYIYYELFTCMECIVGCELRRQPGDFLKKTPKRRQNEKNIPDLIGSQVNRWDVFWCQTHCAGWRIQMCAAPTPVLLSPSGQSGRGRRRWGWSCWQRPGTTPPCRGCSRPRTSTRRAWCPTWTPGRPCTCTGAPRRPRRLYRDPWFRGFCCTACRGAANRRPRHRRSPPCPACFPGRRSSGERGAVDSFPFVTQEEQNRDRKR